jgi:hypothetical protein
METSCPDDEIIVDYMQDRLLGENKAKIETHLASCDLCLEGFVVTRNLVREDDPPDLEQVPIRVTRVAVDLVTGRHLKQYDSIKEKAGRYLNDICSKTLSYFNLEPWGSPALSPIRGSREVVSEGLIHLRKTFENIDTEIEIEKRADRKAHIRIKLSENNRQKKGVRVTLKRDSREISSHLLSGSYVLFEDIPFGRYNLTFTKGNVTLGEYFFEIKESLNG